MYFDHPDFIQPDNEKIKIWRYMDFTKFVSILHTNTLFFSRADKLGDPFEGSLPKVCIDKLYSINLSECSYPQTEEELKNIGKYKRRKRREFVMQSTVSCWNMSEVESAALWRLYLKSNEGIAIQTNLERFKKSFNVEEGDIYIGKINYIDYDKDYFNYETFSYDILLHKRLSFSYEQEIRAIVSSEDRTIKEALKIFGGTILPIINNSIQRHCQPPQS